MIHRRERFASSSINYHYIHLSLTTGDYACDMASFKSALHQQLAILFGHVYSGLAIDLLHFCETADDTKVVLRVLSCDLEMVLQAVSCLSSIQGHCCSPTTIQHTPQLALIHVNNKNSMR